jgi:aspartate/methionine/tyrosine aminotransferase
VFATFTYRASTSPPLGTLHPELPVFHLDGISKRLALPDLKLGWIALNEPAAARFGTRLEILNDAFLSANALTQFMLPTLFEQGQAFVQHMRDRLRAALDLALARLRGCPQVTVHPPDGGYYLFPRIAGWEDEEALVLELLEHGVLVHPGYFYGCEQGVHLMLSCLTEPDQLRAGLDILARHL